MKRLTYTIGAIILWLLLVSPMLHCQTPSNVPCKTFYLNGPWSPGTVYVSCTIVSRNGSSYVATVANYNSDPAASPTKWQLWAAAGTNGKDGATGATGPQGPQGPQGIPGTIPLTPTFTSITLSGPGAATLTCPRGTIWKLDGPMLSCVSGGTP